MKSNPKERKTQMNETEKIEPVCATNCPLNRVVTVHEIGCIEYEYRNSHFDSFAVPYHLVEFKYMRTHHFALHAIKEIGRFDLPVFEFKEKKSPGISGWLGSTTVKWTKVNSMPC